MNVRFFLMWTAVVLATLGTGAPAWAQSSQGIQPSNLQVSVQAGKASYAVGELLELTVNLSADAHLYVFQFDAGGNVRQLLPNAYAPDTLRGAGQHRLPGVVGFDYVVAPPSGSVLIQVVAAAQPIAFGGQGVDEAFPALGTIEAFRAAAERAINAAQVNGPVVSAFASYQVSAPSPAFNAAPTASFNFLPTLPAAGAAVAFDASFSLDPDGQIVQYEWDFNEDGLTDASGPRATTGFTSGSFPVTLRVTDDRGLTATRTKTVVVVPAANQAPIATFSFLPLQPAVGQPVVFDASGSFDLDGRITQYLWDFQSDGLIDASGPRAVTRFGTPGALRVTLTVFDDQGRSGTATQTVTVGQGVLNQPPTARFSLTPTNPAVGELVTLDATPSSDPDGFIAEYQWDFDSDGVIDANGAIARVRFNTAGTARITLTVLDNRGAFGTQQQTLQVRASDQPPRASFSFEPLSANVGDTVIFDASGSFDPDGFISQYRWDFNGDGITDLTGRRVATRFSAPGAFRITLTVVDNQGLTATAQQTIQIGQTRQAPQARFTFNPSTVTVNQTVAFDASGSSDADGFITQYRWDFNGDGITDANGVQAATRFSAPGSFRITLTVVDNDGLTGTTQQTVQVGLPAQAPQARFTFSPSTVIVGERVVFDGSGSSDADGIITEYRWDFNGDGATDASGVQVAVRFNNAGVARVRLTVVDNQGLTGTAEQNIEVRNPLRAPQASFSFSPSAVVVGQAVSFDASASTDPDGTITEYRWDFNGDGITDATGVRATHTFAAAGSARVVLTVVDNDALTGQSERTLQVQSATRPPQADFSFDPATVLAGLPVNFDASASTDPDGTLTEYRWDFDGDSITDATGVRVAHTFTQEGSVQVTLTVIDNDGLTGSITKTIQVEPRFRPPVAQFSFTPSRVVVDQVIEFDASASTDSDGIITEYRWDFDGDTITDATGVRVAHTFTREGTVQVTLTVVDNDGQTHAVTREIQVRLTAAPEPLPDDGPILGTEHGIYLLGPSASRLRVVVQGNPEWDVPRAFSIEIAALSFDANASSQSAQGDAEGSIRHNGNSGVRLTGTVGNGRITFELPMRDVPAFFNVTAQLDASGDGELETSRNWVYVVKGGQRFRANANPFLIVASTSASAMAPVLPFDGHTIYTCSDESPRNDRYQSCAAVE